jgi:hypothetical protein
MHMRRRFTTTTYFRMRRRTDAQMLLAISRSVKTQPH